MRPPAASFTPSLSPPAAEGVSESAGWLAGRIQPVRLCPNDQETLTEVGPVL